MAYLAYYRTFRPQTFDEVVRQEHIVRILKNQIKEGKVGHAYLFTGPRGTGKTTLAKIFARAVNCENPRDGSPCGVCPTCMALADPSNLDITEIDAASNNGVDEMRDLKEKVQYPPVSCSHKVYIIDEVHMLTPSAFNAILKTLEEPPAHVMFILATTEPQKIPATILSRCMRFDFKLIPLKDLEGLVKSVFDKTGKSYESEAVTAIARAGAGSARDCLSIADLCASYSEGTLTYDDVNKVLGSADTMRVADILESAFEENEGEAVERLDAVLDEGKSASVLCSDMVSLLSDVTVAKVCKNPKKILSVSDETFSTLESLAAKATNAKLLRCSEILAAVEGELRYSVDQKIALRRAVCKCASPSLDDGANSLMARIESLERRVEELEKRPAAAAPGPEKKIEKKSEQKREEDVFDVNDLEEPVFDDAPSVLSPASEKMPASFVREEKKGSKAKSAEGENMSSDGAMSVKAEEGDKKTAFARFLRSLRSSHQSILFTLCQELDWSFDEDKMILSTTNSSVYKGLTKEDNSKSLAEALRGIGVCDFEVSLKQKRTREDAVEELKKNFEGVEIKEK